MTTMSYGRAMSWLAEQDGDAVAIICGDQSVTRGELDAYLARFQPDDRNDGWNTTADGESFYYIRNPALGLWAGGLEELGVGHEAVRGLES